GVARSAGGGTVASIAAAAGGQDRGDGTCTEGTESTAARDHGGDVEGQALILDVLARPDEPSALPGRQMRGRARRGACLWSRGAVLGCRGVDARAGSGAAVHGCLSSDCQCREVRRAAVLGPAVTFPLLSGEGARAAF